jgi:hypothetical protein
MNEHAFAPPPSGHFITTVSMIYGGSFYRAGEPRPLSELKKIPPNLRQHRYIVRHDPKASPPANDDAPSLTYTLNTSYNVDENGMRRPKHVAREIVRLEQADVEQRMIEEALSQSNEQEQAALAIVQADHDANVAAQMAEANFKAKERGILPISSPKNLPRRISRSLATIIRFLQQLNRLSPSESFALAM